MAPETSFFCGFFPLKMKGPSGAAPVAVHIPTLPGVLWNSIFDWRMSFKRVQVTFDGHSVKSEKELNMRPQTSAI